MTTEIILSVLFLIIFWCAFGLGYCLGKTSGFREYKKLHEMDEAWINYYDTLSGHRLNYLLKSIDDNWKYFEEWKSKETEALEKFEKEFKKAESKP